MTASIERKIELTHEPFGAGFDVRVVPPIKGEDLDAEFKDYRRARKWAEGIRVTRGWRLTDRTGLAHG